MKTCDAQRKPVSIGLSRGSSATVTHPTDCNCPNLSAIVETEKNGNKKEKSNHPGPDPSNKFENDKSKKSNQHDVHVGQHTVVQYRGNNEVVKTADTQCKPVLSNNDKGEPKKSNLARDASLNKKARTQQTSNHGVYKSESKIVTKKKTKSKEKSIGGGTATFPVEPYDIYFGFPLGPPVGNLNHVGHNREGITMHATVEKSNQGGHGLIDGQPEHLPIEPLPVEESGVGLWHGQPRSNEERKEYPKNSSRGGPETSCHEPFNWYLEFAPEQSDLKSDGLSNKVEEKQNQKIHKKSSLGQKPPPRFVSNPRTSNSKPATATGVTNLKNNGPTGDSEPGTGPDFRIRKRNCFISPDSKVPRGRLSFGQSPIEKAIPKTGGGGGGMGILGGFYRGRDSTATNVGGPVLKYSNNGFARPRNAVQETGTAPIVAQLQMGLGRIPKKLPKKGLVTPLHFHPTIEQGPDH